MPEARLIDANALYAEVDESQAHNNHQGIAHSMHNAEHTHFKFMIDRAPTVEAKPVRHGHWIKYVQFYDTVCTEVPMAECSDCRYITTQENLHNVSENGKELPDFCPCCGADMREELKYCESD